MSLFSSFDSVCFNVVVSAPESSDDWPFDIGVSSERVESDSASFSVSVVFLASESDEDFSSLPSSVLDLDDLNLKFNFFEKLLIDNKPWEMRCLLPNCSRSQQKNFSKNDAHASNDALYHDLNKN